MRDLSANSPLVFSICLPVIEISGHGFDEQAQIRRFLQVRSIDISSDTLKDFAF
jgi:hypothetical protein